MCHDITAIDFAKHEDSFTPYRVDNGDVVGLIEFRVLCMTLNIFYAINRHDSNRRSPQLPQGN